MRETIADIDLSTIEHLDFEVMCESTWHTTEGNPYIGPVEPAKYLASYTCPGCSKHFEKFLGPECVTRWNEIAVFAQAGLRCNNCRERYVVKSWNFKITPIK